MSNDQLHIGVASIEIIPPDPALLLPTGMGRTMPTQGVLDAPRIEAMAIRVGGELAFITASDLRMLEIEWVERIRADVAQRTGCDPQRVLFSAVHNHCFSPMAADESPESVAACEAVNEMIMVGFVDACQQALEALQPAEIASVTATLTETVGENRRVRLSNGTCVTGWGSHPIVPPGLKAVGKPGPDPTEVYALAARRVGESDPFAVMINYDSHPHLYALPYFSGEFPGGVKRRIEQLIEGVTCMHTHGTGGNVDIHCTHPMPDEHDEQVRWFQDSVALLAKRVTDVIVPALADATYQRPQSLVHEYRSTEAEATDHRCRLTILNALALGDVAFVSMPGELFLEFGLAARRTSPFGQTLLLGYNGSRQGYVAPPLGYEQGSYETMRGPSTTAEEEDIRRKVIRARVETGDEIVADIADMLDGLHDKGAHV